MISNCHAVLKSEIIKWGLNRSHPAWELNRRGEERDGRHEHPESFQRVFSLSMDLCEINILIKINLLKEKISKN
jgi:hypothetical protein